MDPPPVGGGDFVSFNIWKADVSWVQIVRCARGYITCDSIRTDCTTESTNSTQLFGHLSRRQIWISCTSHVEVFDCLSGQDNIRSEMQIPEKISGTRITRNLTRRHSHISVMDVAKHARKWPKGWNASII